jgi:hypothetical protein
MPEVVVMKIEPILSVAEKAEISHLSDLIETILRSTRNPNDATVILCQKRIEEILLFANNQIVCETEEEKEMVERIMSQN